MKSKLNEYLKFATLIKRFTAGYADVLIEILTRCKSYGQCALAVREYLQEVLDRLQRNTFLKQLTFSGVGCDLQLPAYNRPLTFLSSLDGRQPIRLVFRDDTFFGNRWFYNATDENFMRTLSIAFDKGDNYTISLLRGTLAHAGSLTGILSKLLFRVEKNETIFGYGTTDVRSAIRAGVDEERDATRRIFRSLVSQALAHKAMRLPLHFVCYVGSERDLFSEPVVEFALLETPSEDNRMILKILGQELVDQLSYVSNVLRNRSNANLFPIVGSTLLHTHEIQKELGEFINYVSDECAVGSSSDRNFRRLHSRILGHVNRIEHEAFREMHSHYLLDANGIVKALKKLLKDQADDVIVQVADTVKIVAPIPAHAVADLIYPFVQNAIAASDTQLAVTWERQVEFGRLNILSHPCVIKIATSHQRQSQSWVTGGRDTPLVNYSYIEPDTVIHIEVYDRGPGIPADVLDALAAGMIGTRLPTTHFAGGRGITNTLLYLRSIPNAEYAYSGFWTIKIRCHSTEMIKEIYGVGFRGAKEVFSTINWD